MTRTAPQARHETRPQTRLWTGEGFRDDAWRHGEDGAALERPGPVILPLEAFLALDEARRAAEAARIGVELQPGEPLEALEPYLDRLPLVALAFPAYTDGRSYSKAQILRARHGFGGEIRATGDVLIDQVAHMLRVGFSSLEISDPNTLARLAAGRTGGIGLHYQPSAAPARGAGGYAWRRVSA